MRLRKKLGLDHAGPSLMGNVKDLGSVSLGQWAVTKGFYSLCVKNIWGRGRCRRKYGEILKSYIIL